MATDVFISYRRTDSAFVRQLYDQLTQNGITAWFDQSDIEPGDHWRTEIAEGIRGCKVFIVVLSPDAVESKNIRKEVDLAERHNKPILPVMWRKTDIPPAFEYALAGIQWYDFEGQATPQKFAELVDVVKRVVGGVPVEEAAQDKTVARTPLFPAVEKETAPAPTQRRLGGLRKKAAASPLALGGRVISSVVTTFNLDIADQDFVNTELKWLFSAADHFLKIRRGELDRSQPVPVPIPPDAQRSPQADNRLQTGLDEFDLQLWADQIEAGFKRIQIHLRNLDILLDQEAMKGEAGKGDVYLQNQIKNTRIEIVKVLREVAELLNQAYGVRVTSPDQLLEFLEQ